MSISDKSILVLGCFDTKGDVFAFLLNCIRSRGESVITVNTGTFPTTEVVDFDADVVASEAGHDIADLRRDRDRGQAIDVMGKGASELVARLYQEGKIKGVIGMGGGGGTYIALSAMQKVPFGIPKLCLTTLATKDLSRQIGDKDIMLIPSVVDVAGMNHILQMLVEQAAAAICAMVNVTPITEKKMCGTVAISMFGNTTACVDRCTELLTREGYEVLAFHATGVGGKTMESLIREGFFDAVLDITTTELADDLCGGICSAGVGRLTAAADMGIPQVVVPGCMDMVNFGHLDTVPTSFADRQLYSWAPDVTLMRTNEQENEVLGRRLAEKVSRSRVPAAIALPLKGISQVDAPGGIFYNPAADEALFGSIRQHSAPHVEVIARDMHINEPAFAALLVDTLLALLRQTNNASRTETT